MKNKILTCKEIKKYILEHNIIPIQKYHVPVFSSTRIYDEGSFVKIGKNQKIYNGCGHLKTGKQLVRDNKILKKTINNKRYL